MTIYEKGGGAASAKPSAYLDNCVVGGLVQCHLSEGERDAMLELIARDHRGGLSLVTS